MYQKTYYVLKESGTYSNALEAFGLATILSKVNSDGAIHIEDNGAYFSIDTKVPIKEDLVESMKYFQTLPYIKIGKDIPDKLLSTIIDYEKEKTKRDNFRNYIQELQTNKPENIKQLIEDYEPKPHLDYDIFSNVKHLQALEGYKKVIANILNNREQFSSLLNELLYLYSEYDNLDHESNSRLKNLEKKGDLKKNTKINSLQIFNPHQGKGLNEPKANRLKNENVPSFWLREWMKMIGAYNAMTIRAVKISNKSWDTKIYVLSPQSLDFNQLLQLKSAFKPRLRGLSAVKLDIASLLSFCEVFIENIPEFKEKKKMFSKLVNPNHFISGFYTAYLKDLGQNKGVSNLSFLHLPSFIDISSYDDGYAWINVLQEHRNIIGTLREDATGSSIKMLQDYRQFLTSSDLDYFFDFFQGYNCFLMQEIAKEHYYIKPFSLKNLEVMFMRTGREFLLILQSQGFKKIAAAIRKSTISLQYTPKSQRVYEVKYGVAQDLKRKSAYKDDLVGYLAEFIAFYNAENARVKERKGDKFVPRANVKQQDIEEVIKLIDDYGPVIVGKLLAAYGYAFDRKDKVEEKSEENLMEVENV